MTKRSKKKSLWFLTTVLVIFCACTNSIDHKIIALQPFGEIDNEDVKNITIAVKEIYEKDLLLLSSQKLPPNSFIHVKSPRYRADKIIRYLKHSKADSIDYVLGFTHKDISTTKKDVYGRTKKPISRYQDWGIFGLGYRPGPTSIVSDFRLCNTSKKKKMERIQKVCVHELGHNFGLKHCPDKKCVMTDACESIKTVDNVKLSLCSSCRKKIKI